MSNNNSHTVIRASLAEVLAVLKEKEAELGKLDAAAGDGDHGTGMVRGMRGAVQMLENLTDEVPAGMLLVQAGSAFSDAAGGASGALYGMFLMNIGKTLGNGPFDLPAIHAAFQAGMAAIVKLGKSKPGDKTMLDTLDPFLTELEAGAKQNLSLVDAWNQALGAAQTGAEGTADIVAQKGRSSKLGERSLGHPDPGAYSMLYLLRAVGAVLQTHCG